MRWTGRSLTRSYEHTLGNDVKHVLHTGIMMMGSSPALSGDTVPPEPIGITRSELDYNMERHGFSLILMEDMEKTRIIRPEYVIAGAMFSRDPRRIFSGIPVMLCNGGINYGLLTYLARRYLFEETLLGIITDAAGRRPPCRYSGQTDQNNWNYGALRPTCGPKPAYWMP